MRRVTMMLVVMAVIVPLFAVVAYAAAGGNTANAHKCEEGGYLDYTKSNGDPFKNEGQCTSYAAKGGQLVPVPTADISLDQAAGTISGTGFTPLSPIRIQQEYAPGGLVVSNNIGPTDRTGAFVASGFDFCFDSYISPIVRVTVTDGASPPVSVTESFTLSCS
jgi:hypothetical protein